MSWEPVIGVASALMPRQQRSTWSEQWKADMNGARELGISRWGLAMSMFAVALITFGGRPSRGRTALAIALGVLAVGALALMPFLAIVYVAVALLITAVAGAKQGMRQLGYAAAGIVAALGSAITLIALLDDQQTGPGPGIALVVFAGAVALAALSFGETWARTTTRPRAAWLAVAAAGVATVTILIMFASFRTGIQISSQDLPDVSIRVYGTIAMVAFFTTVASLVTCIVAGAIAATSRPATESESGAQSA